jgi:hypothetical protein
VDITIAEELLLLAHDEESGTALVRETAVDVTLTGAVLAELTLAGRLGLEGDRLMVLDRSPTGDEELDDVLATIAADQPRAPKWWLDRLTNPQRRWSLLARLAERGVLGERHGRVLGLFRSAQWAGAAVAGTIEAINTAVRVNAGLALGNAVGDAIAASD